MKLRNLVSIVAVLGGIALGAACALHVHVSDPGPVPASSGPARGASTQPTIILDSSLRGSASSLNPLGQSQACTNQNLQWNGSTWVCVPTLSGVIADGPLTGSGTPASHLGLNLQLGNLQGTGSAGNVLRTNLTPTTCTAGNAELTTAADGTSTCTAVVDTMAATSGGGLNCSTTTGAASCGVRTDCSNGQTVTWNGAAWVCGAGGVHPFVFCDGSDGAATISVDTTLVNDKCYTTLVVNSGHFLHTAGFRVFATVSISGPGTIDNNGGIGANGTNTTSGAGGTGTPQGSLEGSCTGGLAGAGSSNAGLTGQCPVTYGISEQFPDTINHASGAGGAGVAAGGAAQTITHFIAKQGSPRDVYQAIDNRAFYIPGGSPQAVGLAWSAGGGGGGGGGAGTGTCGGGGGGGGGGNVVIATPSILSSLVINAIGGNGGNGFNPCTGGGTGGGGGGGGGGAIWTITPSGGSFSTSVAGGTGGTGSFAGSTGAAGIVISIPLP